MKRLLLSLLLIVFSVAGRTQMPMDALRKTAENTSLPDLDRLAAMAQLAQQSFGKGMMESSLFFSQMQYDLALKGGHKKQLAQAVRGIGYYYQGVNDFATAEQYLSRSLDLARASGDPRTIMASLTGLGNIFMYRKSLDSASIYLREGLALAEELKETAPMANLLNSFADIAQSRGNYDEAITYYGRVKQLAEEDSNRYGLGIVEQSLGGLYKDRGDLNRAIVHYLSSLAHFTAISNGDGVASVQLGLGDVYYLLQDMPQAMDYFRQALATFEKIDKPAGAAAAWQKLGIVYKESGDSDPAMDAYTRSQQLYQKIGDPAGIASSLNGIASLYVGRKDYIRAGQEYTRAWEIARQTGLPALLATSLSNLGYLQQMQGQHAKAIPYLEQGLEAARRSQRLDIIRDAAGMLAASHEALGQTGPALEMYKLYVQMRDSIGREDNQRAAIRLEYQFAYEKQALSDSLDFASREAIKDLEIWRQRSGLLVAGIALLSLAILAVVVVRGKKRSDELLLNILPAETARELKAKGYAAAKEYEQATILFTDFIHFTQIAAQLGARELVAEIDQCFQAFDEIITRHGLEKIKTIGDAYMAAGGLPDPLGATPRDVLHAGLEMQAFIRRRKQAHQSQGLPFFEMRIGIHTGPVVAGIVGVKKFQYDVWGDTVNIAARLESSSEAEKVNLSAYTYELVKENPEFEFVARGSIEIKGRGMIEMYFVNLARD